MSCQKWRSGYILSCIHWLNLFITAVEREEKNRMREQGRWAVQQTRDTIRTINSFFNIYFSGWKSPAGAYGSHLPQTCSLLTYVFIYSAETWSKYFWLEIQEKFTGRAGRAAAPLSVHCDERMTGSTWVTWLKAMNCRDGKDYQVDISYNRSKICELVSCLNITHWQQSNIWLFHRGLFNLRVYLCSWI